MFRVFVVVVAFLTVQPAVASEWVVDKNESKIRFSGTHIGNVFEGVFEDWSAEIRFDPENLASAKVRVAIRTASALTGNGLYDGTLKGGDWFDVANHSDAIFEATNFSQKANGLYWTEGILTIRDKSLPFAFDFSLGIQDSMVHMQASQPLDRIDFGLGIGSDADAAWVSREIGLVINLTATRR